MAVRGTGLSVSFVKEATDILFQEGTVMWVVGTV